MTEKLPRQETPGDAGPDSSGAAPAPRPWSKGRIARWIVIVVLGAMLAAQVALRMWREAAVPDDAPVIGVSYDTAWHARAGLSTTNYELCLVHAGARILELDCRADDPDEVLDRIDALLLTGGGDVDAELSGVGEGRAELVDRVRDDFEIALIRGAIERDMPILGICRGVQILNVAHGGTLRNLRDDETLRERHGVGMSSFDGHPVLIEEVSRLAELSGAGEVVVNSFHGQAVDRVADGLRVVATSDDGVIEALEDPDRSFVVATQWHPEVPPPELEYFDRLIEEARRFRRRRAGR